MAGIFHNFFINSSLNKVFETISTPNGLDTWWTKSSSGIAAIGETFHFHLSRTITGQRLFQNIFLTRNLNLQCNHLIKIGKEPKSGFF